MRAMLLIASFSFVSTTSAQMVRYRLTDRPRETWSVGTTPRLEIGGASGVGPSEFTQIVGAARLSDGTIMVGDGASREIRHFAADGRFLRRIARRGRGPGELRELDALIGVGDSVIAFDGREAVQVFTPKGWLRSARRPSLAQHIVQRPEGVLRSDVVLWWVRPGDERPLRATGDSVRVGRVAADDNVVRLIAALPMPPSYALLGGPAIYPLGFAPAAYLAAAAGKVCLGYSIAYRFRCMDDAGRTTLDVERQFLPVPVTEAAKTAFRRAQSGLRADGTSRYEGSLRAHRERVADAAKFADRYPAYSQLILARGGEVWVRDYAMEDGLTASRWRANPRPSQWSVFAGTGAWIAAVTLPARFAPAEIGPDYVLGVMKDDDDLERVVLWPLQR